MTKTNELKVAAEFYFKKGWNIIPFNFQKAVLEKEKLVKKTSFPIDYSEFHKKKVTKELISEWWENHNAIAIITGKISGITVLDIDTKLLPEIKDLPQTFTVETNKGFHFTFKYTDKVRTKAALFQEKNFSFNIDIRNDGGIVYAPPSEYELPNGEIVSYKIIDNSELAEFPIIWLENIVKKYGVQKQEKTNWKNKLAGTILNGERNINFTSIVGGLLNKFPQDDWENMIWPIVKEHNQSQETPLEEMELRTIFNSISQKELQKRSAEGEIKDIVTEVSEDEIRIKITLAESIVCFKAKNIISSLLEGHILTWLKKANGLTHEIPFRFKLNSDTNKEQWARILSKAFDKKDKKEIYPWTLLVNKASNEIEKLISNRKQDFKHSEIVPKEATWLYEPFIQEDQINVFFGLGSSGKTILSLYFSSKMAKTGINSLLVDFENDGSSWADKINKLVGQSGKENFIYFETEQIPIAEQVDKIKETIKKHNIKLVICDSASLATGDSTSDEKAALQLFSALKLLKTTTILIAHQRKNEGDKNPIGSVQYENQARNVWNFNGVGDNSENNILHVACKHTKTNNTYLRKDPIGFKITFLPASIEIEREDAINNFEDKFTTMTRIEKLLSEKNWLSYQEIANELDLSESSIVKNLVKGKKREKFINEETKWSLSPKHKIYNIA